MAISDETREKMSASHRGRHYHSEEHKKRMSERMSGARNPMFGKPNSPEAKAKISASLKQFWKDHPEIRQRCGRKGMPHTEATRKKMAKSALTNHGNSLLQLGERNHFFNKHHNAKTKALISIANKGRLVGELNPSWQGGISFELYPPEFNEELRELIRDRDKHICQLCDVPELECTRKLCVHHIDGDKYNNNPFNLISLCLNCHAKVHNNDSEPWGSYLKNKILKICAQEGGD